MGILRGHRGLAVASIALGFVSLCFAQSSSPSLIRQPIDESQLVTLRGNTHPLARAQFDIGTASPDLQLNRMLLVLKRSPEQEYALQKLLDNQQDKASPNYHKWLTPDDFGKQFGPSDQDVQTVTGWLQSRGFQVKRVSHGRNVVEFSGAESQVEEALHTQIHKYLVNGEAHWANASDPQIPAALAPAVAGILSLNNFPRQPMSELIGTYSPKTRQLTPANPLFTLLGWGCDQNNNCYALGPPDFGVIYNVQNLWNAGIDGTGQTIAIVGETDINLQDDRDFRNLFGLPANDPTVIYNGPDPGVQPDESEADIDVQWSGAIAPKATIDFVVSQSTETTAGVDLSALYIIDNNLAPVMSESYGACELFLGTSGNQFYNTLWAQAAAQGITAILASGDSGSAVCDRASQGARYGLQVSGFASTPFNVAIGGTDFNDVLNPQQYWNSTNASGTQESAKGYIPETTWNGTCTNSIVLGDFGWGTNAESNCNNYQLLNQAPFLLYPTGGSGGVSSCTVNDGQNSSSCSGGYAKPSWQVAPGVPADGRRDIPDVSLFASNGIMGNFYVFCQADSPYPAYANCAASQYGAAGGTSFGAPAFAGIMALINQKMKAPQGNANYVLYKLAGQQTASSCNSSTGPASSCVFNDITSGTIAMPCVAGDPDCVVHLAGDQYGVLSGYNTGTGYDLATGLGSLNVTNLVNKWSTVAFAASTTTLSLSPTSSLTHGQAVTVSGTVAATSGKGTPSGSVALMANGVPCSSGTCTVSAGNFTLSNGAISGSTKLLPGGGYTVTAHYSGDATFGGSDSTPVNVTIGKENSSSLLGLVTFDWNGNLVSNSATSAVYGSYYLLRVDVLDGAGNPCQVNNVVQFGCPTGSVSLTDNGSPLDAGTFALNSLGYTEDQSIQLPGGTNSVQAQYPGDSSFNASSTVTALSITPAPSSMSGTFYGGTVSANYSAYATIQSQSSGVPPSGTVTFYANGTLIPGNVTYSSWSNTSTFPPTVTYQAYFSSSSSPFPSPGNYTITARYSGDTNYQASSTSGTTFFVKFPNPTVTLQSSANSVNAGSTTTLLATVLGESPTIAPTGTISFNGANAGALTGTVSYATVKDSNTGNLDLQGSLIITPGFTDGYFANYSGDVNYPLAGVCCATTVTVNGNDFVLSANQGYSSGPPGYSAYFSLLVGFQSNTAPVSLSCSGLPSEATCNFNGLPNPISYPGTYAFSISTTASNAAVTKTSRASNHSLRLFWLSSMLPFAAMLLIGYGRSRSTRSLSRLLLTLLLLLGIACGGGSSGGGGGGGGGGSPPAAPTSLTATAMSSSRINLGWFPSDGAAAYDVYRSTSSGFSPSSSNRIASTNQSSFYPDSGLSPSTTYYYLVKATNSAGSSGPSNQASASTQAFDPGTPAGTYTITVTGTSGSISHSVNFTLVVN